MACRTAALLMTLWASVGIPQTISKDPLGRLSDAIRQITRRVAPAVVEIVVTGYATTDDGDGQTANRISRQRSSGSGVLLDPGGYIMTNAHVVQGAVRIKVVLPEIATAATPQNSSAVTRIVDGRILGIDRESDLALLKVDEKALPVLRFGDSDNIQQGDLVFAIGSPLGLRNSVSMGVVSAPARVIHDDSPIAYIQTDASINPGNSGGALVDTRGVLVGMNTFIVSQSGGSEGIGFAIPGNIVRSVYEQLRKNGHVSRGVIGVGVQDITSEMAAGLGLAVQHGVIVADVDPDSPAVRAGIKRRDVIVSVNGQAITAAQQLENSVYRRQDGELIRLTILRGTDLVTVTAKVQEQPNPWEPLAGLASPEKNLVRSLGILCVEIDRQAVELLGPLRREYGLLVVAKSPEGQSQLIDLQTGDIIHAMNNLPVASLAEFQQMVQQFKPGDAVVLQIERDRKFRYVAFAME